MPRRRAILRESGPGRPSGSLSCPDVTPPATTIAFFGPQGTFTEEALLQRARLRELAALKTQLDHRRRPRSLLASEQVDLGFVPIENAIDGTVREHPRPLPSSTSTCSFSARSSSTCISTSWLLPGRSCQRPRRADVLPGGHRPVQALSGRAGFQPPRCWPAVPRPTPPVSWESTQASRAAVPPAWRPTSYGLEVIAEDVEDFPGNRTRFVSSWRASGSPRRPVTIGPASSGHQRDDRPGNCMGSSDSAPLATTSTSPSSNRARPSQGLRTIALSSISDEAHLRRGGGRLP